MVSIKDRIFIYPHPVIKDKKYLIEFDDQDEAMKVISEIENDERPSPDENLSLMSEVDVHTDGNTVIYRLKD